MLLVFSRNLLPSPSGSVKLKNTNMVVYPRNMSLHQQFVSSVISNNQSLPNKNYIVCIFY